MRILLLELGDLRRDDELAVARVGIAREVLLVIVLGGEEGLKRRQLGDNGVCKKLLGAHFFDHRFGIDFLGIRSVEDRRAVLGAYVRALAIKGGRVVDGEEDVQQVREGDDGGVEGDLHGLGMPRGAAANLFIGGVWAFAASVAGNHICDAPDLVKDRFKAPEASTGKHGFFKLFFCHFFSIQSYG